MSKVVIPVLDETDSPTHVILVDPTSWTYYEIHEPEGEAHLGLVTADATSLEAVLEVALGNSTTLHAGPAREVDTDLEAMTVADQLLLEGRRGVPYLSAEDAQRLDDLRSALAEICAKLRALHETPLTSVQPSLEMLAADLGRCGDLGEDIGYRKVRPRSQATVVTVPPDGSVDGPSETTQPIEPPETPLEDSALRPNVIAKLRNAGLETIEQVLAHTDDELLALDSIGPATVKVIRTILHNPGEASESSPSVEADSPSRPRARRIALPRTATKSPKDEKTAKRDRRTPSTKGRSPGSESPRARRKPKEPTAVIAEGDIVNVTVTAVNADGVSVKIGSGGAGWIPPYELDIRFKVDPREVTKVGATLEAVVMKERITPTGRALLSVKRARAERVWPSLAEAMKSKVIVEGPVVDASGGRLTLDLGVRGYLPADQIDLKGTKVDLRSYLGKTVRANIVTMDEDAKIVMLSRRPLLSEGRGRRGASAADL